MLFGGKLLIDDAALGFANALNDDLLGGLGSDAPELLGLHGDGDHVAELGAANDLFRALLIDLVVGILHRLNDRLVDDHLNALFILVEDDLDVVLAAGIIPAEGG